MKYLIEEFERIPKDTPESWDFWRNYIAKVPDTTYKEIKEDKNRRRASKRKKLNRWSRKYDSCRACDETKRIHRAYGYCNRCYFSVYLKTRPKQRKAHLDRIKRNGRKRYSTEERYERYKNQKENNTSSHKATQFRARTRYRVREWLRGNKILNASTKSKSIIRPMRDGTLLIIPFNQTNPNFNYKLSCFMEAYDEIGNNNPDLIPTDNVGRES